MAEEEQTVKVEVTQQASPARFFNDNRAIAGFGNSTRAVFTSVRELGENGLEASETRVVAPVMDIKLEKLSQKEVSALLDVSGFEIKRGDDFLRLSCKDNGIGVEHLEIPKLFGRVLLHSTTISFKSSLYSFFSTRSNKQVFSPYYCKYFTSTCFIYNWFTFAALEILSYLYLE